MEGGGDEVSQVKAHREGLLEGKGAGGGSGSCRRHQRKTQRPVARGILPPRESVTFAFFEPWAAACCGFAVASRVCTRASRSWTVFQRPFSTICSAFSIDSGAPTRSVVRAAAQTVTGARNIRGTSEEHPRNIAQLSPMREGGKGGWKGSWWRRAEGERGEGAKGQQG